MCIADTFFQIKLPVTRGLSPTRRVRVAGIVYTTTHSSASGFVHLHKDRQREEGAHEPGAGGP